MIGGLAVVSGAAVIVGAPRLGATFPILEDLARHPGLLAACTVGYSLGIGRFCSQLLFSLSAPMRPLVAAWAGLVALATTSIGAAGPARRCPPSPDWWRGDRLRLCRRGAGPPGLHARRPPTYYRTL